MTGQSLKLGKFMTDIVANMFGHVGWLSIISTLQQTLSLSLCMSWCTFLHLYYLSWSISESHHLFFADLLMYKFTFNVMYWLDSCLTEPASSTSPIVHVIFALKISNTIYSLQTVNIIEKYLIFLCDLLVWILLPRLN